MKKATLIAIVVTLSSLMFASVNITWGNAYMDTDGEVGATPSFGVWFDVNDATSVGWENGLKVGLDGPAASSFRLGFGDGTSLGVNYNWWEGGGAGWNTTLGTALDFTLTDEADDNDANTVEAAQGDMKISINLGFGF